ncbi:hypothetical protein E3E31_00450 [Thermococcus sp. M39]|uniref:hypothetical protein n=1 Tax=unclassified Thermococcus TaxID=2627626 RepID=UPI0014398B50|nr:MULTISPECIES: hypothetical protein [unclassified Thermococcus]NJE07025.1 hypothetical protein [Thermococcus sp. M39]NJE12925.1 hypothetical protein [Thermococcus sp. LS2]
MKRALVLLMLLLFAGNALALSVNLGIDEVLIIDNNSVVTFEVSQKNPDLILLTVETPNGSFSKIMSFGETLKVNSVNYTIGRLDLEKLILTLHLSGNYSRIKVMKKKDFSVELVESFDTYIKLKITNTGYYAINDTLVINSQDIILAEIPLFLEPGEFKILKVKANSNVLTLMLKESKISKTTIIPSFNPLVTIEKIWKDEKLHVLIKNHGDAVNATLKLIYNGLTIEKKEIQLSDGEEKDVIFESNINQGTIVVDYGVLRQESFYFESPQVSLIKAEKIGDTLKVWLKNEGKIIFVGKVSIYQNSVIVGKPYYKDIKIEPNKEVIVEFKVPENIQFLTIAVSSRTYSLTFPISLQEGVGVKALNPYAKGYLGGKAVYILSLSGNGKVEFGVEGLPDSIKYAFYYNDAQIKELNVVQPVQINLILQIPKIPQGFTLNELIRFNVTVNNAKIPLELEVSGEGILPVYGDNWLAKINYTSEYHHVGVPYKVIGNDITPPYLFEPWNGKKIAVLYGRYVRQGRDLRIHLLDFSGRIIASSTQEKGRSDCLIFNQSGFMIMVEGDGYFNSVLLVADYLEQPRNLTFELRKRDFGIGLRTFILNATPLRGKKLELSVNSTKSVELRVYYFTLNREKEDFDPLSTDFKGVFRGSGKEIRGEIGVRSYEDFIAVAIVGEGNVSLKFNVKGSEIGVKELSSKEAYLIILVLLGFLVMMIYLEKKIG